MNELINDNKTLEDELEWHLSGPKSKYWNNLINNKHRKLEISEAKLLLAKKYINIHNKRDLILNDLNIRERTELACKLVCNELIDSTIYNMIHDIVLSFQQLKYQLIQSMKDVIVKSTYNILNYNDMSTEREPAGLVTLLKGSFLDMIFNNKYKHHDKYNYNSTFNYSSNQLVIQNCQSIQYNNIATEQEQIEVISIENKSSNSINDMIKVKPLSRFENTVWNDITIQSIANGSILLPNTCGDVAVIHVHPQANCDLSYLFVGTSLGILLVYSICWDGSPPSLLYMTPALSKQSISPIVEIKCSYMHSNQIITRYDNGIIKIWNLTTNKPINQKTIWKKFFSFSNRKNKFSNSNIFLPTNLFQLNLSDYLLPKIKKRPLLDRYLKRINRNRNKINNTKDNKSNNLVDSHLDEHIDSSIVLPTNTCFYNNFSILGSNQSLLVGLSNGNIMKFNMDYQSVASTVSYLPTLTRSEYSYLPNDNDILIKGKHNKTYRELFYHHKYPIIYLSILNVLDCKIISMDSKHYVIIWKYDLQLFTGKYWFAPLSIYQLDFTNISYINISDKLTDEPSSEIIKQLVISKKYKQVDDIINYIVEEFYTLTYIDRYIQYYRYTDESNQSSQWISYNVQPIRYNYELVDVKITNDYDDLIVLMKYTIDNKIKYICIYTYQITNKSFHKPYPKIDLQSSDHLANYLYVSHIVSETLSRYAYIMINYMIRIFSLSTGIEIIQTNKQNPLYIPIDVNINSFTPTMISICSNRLIVLADRLDKRINVYILVTNNPLVVHQLTDFETNCLDRSINDLKSKAIKLNAYIDIYNEDKEIISYIRDSIIDELVMNLVNKQISKIENLIDRKKRIELVYGRNDQLGSRYPTTWPIDDIVDDKLMKVSQAIESINVLLQDAVDTNITSISK